MHWPAAGRATFATERSSAAATDGVLERLRGGQWRLSRRRPRLFSARRAFARGL